MKSSPTHIVLALGLALALGGAAEAGAPQPDQRQGEFAHVCAGGANKGLACTVPTQDADCPKSACVLQPLSKTVRGTLTMIAHDQVTDWSTGAATHRALTVLLEVKAPDGSRQLLAATYQDIDTPTEPPTAPGNVVAIAMDELAVNNLAKAVNGLLFVQPESALSQQLQALFGNNGTPALVAVNDRKVDFAEHGGDALATVLRFKVKIQFLDPA
jgi:hypothetical protein